MPRCVPIYHAEVVTVCVLDDPERPCARPCFRFCQDACAGDLIGLCLRSRAERIKQERWDDQSAYKSRGVEHHRRSNTVVGRLFATGSVNLWFTHTVFAGVRFGTSASNQSRSILRWLTSRRATMAAMGNQPHANRAATTCWGSSSAGLAENEKSIERRRYEPWVLSGAAQHDDVVCPCSRR